MEPEWKIEHFSHVHPLVFERLSEKYEEVKKFTCNGCCQRALDHAYRCQPCDYLLHKRCAKLPREIEVPKHPQHLLTLNSFLSGACVCNVCSKSKHMLAYFCPPCHYSICISCFLQEEVTINTIHEHPLDILTREALFYCNVCGKESTDSSYLCHTCHFWIHESCASLPSNMKVPDHRHHHPLTLIKQYLHNITNFKQDCRICGDHIRTDSWTYGCAQCRYFAHVRCAISTKDHAPRFKFPPLPKVPTQLDLKTMTPEILDAIDIEEFFGSRLQLPVEDNSEDPSTVFIGRIRLEEIEIDPEIQPWILEQINHWSHEHYLIRNNEVRDDDKVFLCSGCNRPISIPFYSCSQCKYFLHLGCTIQPNKLIHGSHPEHSLKLNKFPDACRLFRCKCCHLYRKGFFYRCETCEFTLDLNCAGLPESLVHQAHRHPLVRGGTAHNSCNSSRISFGLNFKCDPCNFHIDYRSLMFPGTVKHRYDRHPIILRYFPLDNHPDEYHCEFCENEMNPKYWMYHCQDCDQSFHPGCILSNTENMKYGDTQQVDDHPHPLTFVKQATNKSICCCCEKPTENDPLLECQECTYVVCLECIRL